MYRRHELALRFASGRFCFSITLHRVATSLIRFSLWDRLVVRVFSHVAVVHLLLVSQPFHILRDRNTRRGLDGEGAVAGGPETPSTERVRK